MNKNIMKSTTCINGRWQKCS